MTEAFVFDLDGVIVDTEPLHLLATQHALALVGRNLAEEEYYRRYVALTDRELFEALLGDENLEVEHLVWRKQWYYRELMGEGVKGYPDVVAFIQRAVGTFPLALATGSTREEAEAILTALGLRKAFGVVVSCEDYAHGKPHPEPYLIAARDLGLSPKRCLAVEDTVDGVRAAKEAGMACLALPHTYPPEALVEADLVLGSLDEIEPEELLRRFR
jgi:HAD superfamily hydrolase (TIGR01509 family)